MSDEKPQTESEGSIGQSASTAGFDPGHKRRHNMSSARKRAAIQKANNEAEFLRQRLMRAEHHASVMESFAKAAAMKSDALYSALAELVALKAMKDELSLMLLREEGGMGLDYDRRKPLAWQRARELVGSNYNSAT